MKRAFFTLLLLCVAASSFATLPELWRIKRSDNRSWWSSTADRRVRSAKYNAATDHVCVVSRSNTPPQLAIVNAATGADVSQNELSLVTGGTFVVDMMGVDSTGVVYIGNLTTDISATAFKIYRLADENAAETEAFNATQAIGAVRVGDTMDVTGTGTGTKIWCGTGAAAGPHVLIFTTGDGSTFTLTTQLTIPGSFVSSPSRLGLSAFNGGSGDVLWINSSTHDIRRINTTSGAIDDTIDNTLVTEVQNHTLVGYTEIGGRKYVASAGGTFAAVGQEPGVLVDVTNSGSKFIVDSSPSLKDTGNVDSPPNPDGTGDVDFDTARNAVVFTVTKNVVASFSMAPAKVGDWNTY